MSNTKPNIVVESYKSSWADDFKSIRDLVWPKIHEVAAAIEHVGSTSVPGLAAKPIIDVDVIVNDVEKIPVIIERLKSIGYEHPGDLGIKRREAFKAPPDSVRQNFYVCLSGVLALRNHLILRDHLRMAASRKW
ncbi:MAG: GrpB family protein [Bdellovibrionaceae bacterium]|nr:GrpB family protein [Pseudobdellovibrionaceae bacterium]